MDIKENFKNIIFDKHHLSDKIWSEFESLFSERKVNKKAYFITSGQYVSKIAFIFKGVFRSYFTDYFGKEINQAFLVEDDFIASRLIPNSKSLVNIQALTDCNILVADAREITKLANKHHSIALLLLKTTAFYFNKNQDREVMLRIQDAKENYLYFLKQHPGLIDKIPHYYIANHLHISSTHLSRIRKILSLNST